MPELPTLDSIAAEAAQLEADLAKVPALQQRLAYLAGMRDCLAMTTDQEDPV